MCHGNNHIFNAKEMLDNNLPFKIYKQSGKMVQGLHAHDYVQVWYVSKGCCIHHFDGKDCILNQGDIFILPPNIYHALKSESNTILIGLEFTESFIADTAGSGLLQYAYLKPFIGNSNSVKPRHSLEESMVLPMEALLEETIKEFKKRDKYYELFIKANLLKILAILTREYDEKHIDETKKQILSQYKNAMTKALTYINNHYQEKIYLSDLCKYTLMSPSNFSSIFKKTIGKTPTDYINYVRITNAKRLLQTKEKTINGVACATGFFDGAYFHKMFKRETGLSPSQYRSKYVK